MELQAKKEIRCTWGKRTLCVMKILPLLIAILLIALVFSVKNGAQPTSGQRTPVLVELFTSEGCSSCPPADKLLIQLKQNQPVAGAEVIALGQHVDYWNSIGWADRFSSPQFSARQQQYADRLNDGPYTPQMVVDGTTSVVGNDSNEVSRTIARAAAKSKPVLVELTQINGSVAVRSMESQRLRLRSSSRSWKTIWKAK